jgi:hypothetical protein
VTSTYNPRAIARLRAQVDARCAEILLAARTVMSEAVADGALRLQDNLEAAVTETGSRRATYFGGFPGRHETGEMVGSIGYEGEDGQPYEDDGRVETFAFGWFPGNFRDYFYEQDVGEGNIPAADAMEPAFEDAKKYVREHMPFAVGGL